MKRALVALCLTLVPLGCLTLAPSSRDAGTGGRINCGAAPHEMVDLIPEPDGSETCVPGACEPGWADCDGNPENGCESSLFSVAHCGACDFVCPSGMACGTSQGIGYCLPGDGGADDAGSDASNPLVPDAGN